VYKHCKVNIDSSRSSHFLIFDAICKDCNNSLRGWSDTEPQKGCLLEIQILTRDTREQELKHNTKRHLKGLKRKIVAKQMVTDIASNWRRNQASLFQFDRTSPPNLYHQGVLRKAKQEHKDKTLGITVKCPIYSLVELKHSQFATSIHFIGIDPLLVHYWSQFQIIIYKDINKKYSKLSIDATGGVVKKIKRTSMNLLSAHIFLYEAVVSTEYGQLPVCQMISEKQDTLTIATWLLQWLRCGVKVPNKVVCDYSTALLGAIIRAFCGLNMRTYVSQCFDLLVGKCGIPPNCYVRIDIAHMMKIFSQIPSLKGVQNRNLKHFYVCCLCILLTSTVFDDFTTTLKEILIVVMSETDGWVESTVKTPSELSRLSLLSNIKDIDTDFLNHEDGIINDDMNIIFEDGEEEENGPYLNAIEDYLKDIEEFALKQS